MNFFCVAGRTDRLGPACGWRPDLQMISVGGGACSPGLGAKGGGAVNTAALIRPVCHPVHSRSLTIVPGVA